MSAAGAELLGVLYVVLGVPLSIIGLLAIAVAGAAALDRTGT